MKKAFSLVELSIVLVILGLLVGGVLSGQSLIRASEVRTVTVDAQRFMAATHTFRDKYLALPGDMANATAFWGVAAGTGTDVACRNFKSTTTATCNGNGDGKILTVGGGIYEDVRYWQQLSNAGLIEGRYVGTWSGVSNTDENSPRLKFRGKHWGIYNWNIAPGDTTTFAGDYGNGISTHEYDILKPEEAWNIDKKVDDGIPNSGKFWVGKGDSTYPCTTRFGQATDTGAEYNLTETSVACYPFYILPF